MPDHTNRILLTGYWPPTNHMLRQFSTNPDQNPNGWKGGNWRGHGFDVHAFFPEFEVPDSEVGQGGIEDVGVGDFQVDYQGTLRDFDRVTAALRPCAIVTSAVRYASRTSEQLVPGAPNRQVLVVVDAYVSQTSQPRPASRW